MSPSRSQRWRVLLLLATVAACYALAITTAQSPTESWWTGYGNGPDNSRYFPSTQITRSNVSGLQPAWTYPFGDAGSSPIVVRGVRKVFPVSSEFHGHHWFVHIDGKRFATPIFVCLAAIVAADIAFAIDSIPAAFAITRDSVLIWMANIFALLGLRALFVLVEGLIDLRILRRTPESNSERETYRPYFMHGTSHWLGLDVHDVGWYRANGKSRKLRPGMVLTVEPGLYLAPDAPKVPKRLQGIGIRIEDDVLVTSSGRRNLSARIPSATDDLEAIVGHG